MGFARHTKVSDLNSLLGILQILYKYCKIICLRIDSMIYMYIRPYMFNIVTVKTVPVYKMLQE